MAAEDALGRQFGQFHAGRSYADNSFPAESDEDGTFLDRREAVSLVMKAKPASARKLFSMTYNGTGSRSSN